MIGAGAAGLMAAGTAASLGAEVWLFEKNGRLGKKIVITGKGRCNLTNDCGVEEFIVNVPRNPRFLRSALAAFPPSAAMEFFGELGVPLTVERGGRVFPASGSSFDVVDALRQYIGTHGARVVYEEARALKFGPGGISGLETAGGFRPFDKVVVCTGGLSYPSTGSTGDGYRFASRAGHTVTPLAASLVPLEAEEGWCAELMGLSLRNVTASLYEDGKKIYSGLGELLFTHFGVSGPLILSASAYMSADAGAERYLSIDLKPGLDEKKLEARILLDFGKYSNRIFANSLDDLLPKSLIPVIVRLSGIDGAKKVNSVTKEERRALISQLKGLRLGIKGRRPVEEAVVTRGGVDVREVNPATMESRLVPGLYFAGEVLDVDALTGGFNLHIAFATGRLAGRSAASGG